MGLAVIPSNTTIKISAAASNTTLSSSQYAIVDFTYTSGVIGVSGATLLHEPITRYYGPGQTIPATITVVQSYSASTSNLTYTLSSGVIFSNSP